MRQKHCLFYLFEFWQLDFLSDGNIVGVGEGVVHDDVRSNVLIAILLNGYASNEVTRLHDVRLERTYYLVLTIRHLCELRLWGWCFFYWSLHLWLHRFFYLYRWLTQELIC